MTFSFIKHITDHIRRPRFGTDKFPTFWPSESSATVGDKVYGACRRKVWLRYLSALRTYYGKEETDILKPEILELLKEAKSLFIPYSAELDWINQAGNMYEEFLINAAKTSGVYIADQVPIYIKELNLSGKIDCIIINPQTGLYRAVEAKSVNDNSGKKIVPTSKGPGTPKDINLMQIATYVSEFCNNQPDFEGGELVYGNRGSGAQADFLVQVQEDNIFYKQIIPVEVPPIKSPITISSIKNSWAYLQNHVTSQQMPPRDFSLVYNEEQLKEAHEEGKLTKTQREQYEKVVERRSDKTKKELKQVVTGDKDCVYCPYTNFCYKEDGTPRV